MTKEKPIIKPETDTKSVFRIGSATRKTSLESAFANGLSGTPIAIRKNKAHGGDIGMCPRKSVIHCFLPNDFTVPSEASSSLYMAIGTALHIEAAKAYHNAGILRKAETRVEMPRIGPPAFKPLTGYIDLILDHEGKLVIIDLKTCGQLPGAVKSWHAEQVIVYAIMSGIKTAYVQYLSRSVADYRGAIIQRILPVLINDDSLMAVARRIAMFHVYGNAAVVPPIGPHLRSSKDCGWCPFIASCWNGLSLPTTGLRLETERAMSRLTAKAERLGRQLVDTMPERLASLSPLLTPPA